MLPAVSRLLPGAARTLPGAARRRLTRIAFGWALVAVAEAAAYTTLTWAIADGQPPGPVLGAAGAAVATTVLVSRAGYLTGARLAGDLYDTLGTTFARARLSWFTETNRALVRTVAGRAIPTLMSVPAHQLQTFILPPLIPLLLLAGVGIVGGPSAMLFVGALLAVAFVAQSLAQRALARADADRGDAEQAAAAAALEFVDHLELLRTAAGPERAVARLMATWQAQEAAFARTNNASAPATLVSGLAAALPLAGVVVLLAATGTDDPAAALALVVLTGRAAAPLDALALAGLTVNDLRTTVRQYRTVATAPALPEPPRSAPGKGYGLELAGIAHPPVLRDVSALVPEGSRVLITGPTGSGKSTLLNLLMRFDDPEQGRVTLGGAALTDLRYEDLAAHFAYVPQDPIVFDGTLAGNIRLGNPAATDDEVLEVCRTAHLDTVVTRSPHGIHQQVGHQGNALSGGERQRVALARALLKNAPVLVLDEATAALDATTERHILRALRQRPGTVIAVTHRDTADWDATVVITLRGNASPPTA
ncbi:ATP-binding cassette domain-containing protein [Streptomyces clavuligerus]|nr:ATP-binding cassette domain-containing protein [Streptomyces clavuligerus]QPL66795.1 ATP-binding cassette domain-containing protein [Streptomyces clavuligerus]QPL72819.1 ATP-binding cassette domain-containing protein [Streptomyces clavuligerus]QPL78903.1 ATP-binding cassette domain-containing protein [Streptomyces clavuligerus]QPL84929.1 ATP-binding cassette domain-containing protein [Streptomyces clavuligerus]